MAIKISCDECSKEIPNEKTPITLRMSRKSMGDILDMDLCQGCARFYLGTLKGTNSSDNKAGG